MIFEAKGKILLTLLVVILISGTGCITISPVTPTLTPTPVGQHAALTSTATVVVTPDEAATSSTEAATSIAAITSTVIPYRMAEYPAPDGKWSMAVDRYECSNLTDGGNSESIAYEQIRLIDPLTKKETVITDQIQNCGGLGAFGFQGLYWSPSSQYFYYNDSREGQPDGGCGGYLSLPIYRLDTETNQVIKLDGGFLSPDKTKLAMWHDHRIVIWDLDKGEIGENAPRRAGLFEGKIWWSQKSDAVLFLQTENQCAPDFGKSYITSMSAENFSQEQIASSDLTRVTNYPVAPPAGEFVLASYPPLALNYDPDQWQDESLYIFGDSSINYLQARDLPTCYLSVLKSLTVKENHSSQQIRIGKFNFTVTTLDEPPPDFSSLDYAADQFIEGYSLSHGAPIFSVSSIPSEWEQCQTLGEEVLSTLHVAQ